MMADARSGAFKMLLFWSLDRLSREGVWKTLGYLRDLDEALVCWRSHSEPYLDSCGVFKEAILAILAAIAKQERMRISERVKAGLEVARANGKRPGRRKHEENVELNNQIIELFRNGRSIREIALLLEISPTPVQRILKPLQPEKPKKVKPAPPPYVPTTTGLGLIKVGE